ncbi:MAG: HlyD family type I secretion periplasmic adaptor subunit [Alphaproteobacteria bacterium]
MKTRNNYSIDEIERKLLKAPAKSLQWFIYILFVMIVIIIIWAMLFTIEIRVQGMGKTISEGRVQKVQNLEGGIVKEILTQYGRTVKKGEVLVRFSEVDVQAKVNERKAELFGLKVQSARLQAEGNAVKPVWPKATTESQKIIIKNEMQLYQESQASLKSLLAGIKEKIKQETSRLNEIKYRYKGQKSQIKLVKEYYSKIKMLYKEGIASEIELNMANRDYINTQTEVKVLVININSIQDSINQLQEDLKERMLTFRTNIRSKNSDIDIRIKNIESGLESLEDDLSRREVVSPINGVIKKLRVNTIGEVLKPGEVIAEIVPVNEKIQVEAEINPKDIAYVKEGQKVMVRLTAFDFSIYGGINGTVKKVWPDSVETPKGKVYYRIIVELEKSFIQGTNTDPMMIMPGMVANIDVITGNRSVMDYVLKPLKRGMYVSFTER